jgi:threonine aldolase
MNMVDLRSDTVTQPSPAMRKVIARAVVGDDTHGDDPSVNALQQDIADRLGFEAALFFPSGTQSNLCAILSHCERGDEYLVGQNAHCYRFEGGGAAVFGSVQPQPLAHLADGTLSLEDIRSAVKPDDAHFARTRLLALENTFGGKVMPMDFLSQATRLARELGLASHLDGARLFNAAVAQACEQQSDPWTQAKDIVQPFDSVSVCFSKGLGAPLGSALCGSTELIARARRLRKTAGGSMRQAGMMAAAASYALEHHVLDLQQDHDLALRLAAGLREIADLRITACATNMVFIQIKADSTAASGARTAELVRHLHRHGVLATGLYELRFVTHRDVDQAGVDKAIAAVRNFFK